MVVVVFCQVRERGKAEPQREDCGEVEAEVVVVEESEGWALLGWLKLVVRERRRAEKGEGKGAGVRLMVLDGVVGDDDDDDGEDNSSMVVSRPSK